MNSLLSQNFQLRLGSTLLLLTLHAAIVSEIHSPVARSLILAHMGLFLIWQPIWRGDQKLNWQNTIVFLLLVSAFTIWLDWWLLTGWLILLIGLTGGRLPQTTQERNINLVILFFLFIELLISCASHLFPIKLDTLFITIFNTGLFFLPLVILVMPEGQQANKKLAMQVDLFGALTTALLASLLLLGSVINSSPLTEQDYSTALVETFLFIGVLILLISWLLSPRTGFRGLADLWTQSLLNIGTPFEYWVSEIASLKGETESAEEFLNQATYKLLSLPMIDGVVWHSGSLAGRHGIETHNPVNIVSGKLNITIMTSRGIGGTLLLHFKLLVRIIDHFYTAKQQERELARQAHMQAIYETGARITHDIKNLLQSFHNITAAISNTSTHKSEATLNLLRQQLPVLTQRLELALEKLKQPDPQAIEYIDVESWWNKFKAGHNHLDANFVKKITINRKIPGDLFDTVTENLLENAIQKRQMSPELDIHIAITSDTDRVTLSVIDNGSALPDKITSKLFTQPVNSANGLGVGLLQSAELARKLGYKLYLENNVDGEVKFTLETEFD